MGFFDSIGGAIGGIAGALNPVGLVANIGAGLLGGGIDYFSAQQAANAQRDVNAENVRLSQSQMAFQERMSSTAFQRAKLDMQKAGINPMLAATNSASTPSGSVPVQGAVPPTIGALSSGAKDMIRLLQDLKESNSRIKLNRASGEAQWASGESGAERNYAQQRLIEQNTWSAKMQNELLENEMKAFRSAPGIMSWLKLLRDRGLGVSTARDALSLF